MYKPGIKPQEHYYSGNRHCHCIHTQVVITSDSELESRSGRGVQHYMIKFVSDTTGRWLSQCPPISSTNKTDRHDITEILLEVALNTTIKQTNKQTNDGTICYV